MRKGSLLAAMTLLMGFSNVSVVFGQTPNATKRTAQKSTNLPMLVAFDGDEVKLEASWIRHREDLNRQYLYSLDPERLLHNFRINAGIKSSAQPLEGWEAPQIGLRGHFTGHYLSACASLIKKDQDTVLTKRINYMVDALEECQQKLGGKYLSAFPESDFATLETTYGGVWAPYYTYHKIMQGLLDVYLLTGNRKAYRMVLNMADFVKLRMSRLSEDDIEKILYTTEGNPVNEPGAMNEVLHHLFAISKDSSHFKLANIFDRTWFSKPLSEHKDILSGLHSNTHLVLVNGYARRYENTNEVYYRNAAVNFWDMLQYHHAYVNGSSSGPRPIANTPTAGTAEHWGAADRLSTTLTGQIAESCVTHNTQKLTATLFRWTGSPEYADAYMNRFYNAVLALQSKETGATVYHLPLGSPQKKEFLKDNDFRCCNGTGIEAFTILNSNVYFHDTDNIWINLYTASRLEWKEKKVAIEQKGNFPEESAMEIKVTTDVPKRFTLHLFIPSWANPQTAILINGKPMKETVKPLSYAQIPRVWSKGDQVKIVFDYTFRLKGMPDNDNVISLSYGPVLLAFETGHEVILKGNREAILKNLSRNDNEFSFQLKNNDKVYKLLPFYDIERQHYGVYATIRNEY